jgi:hypothetical protein
MSRCLCNYKCAWVNCTVLATSQAKPFCYLLTDACQFDIGKLRLVYAGWDDVSVVQSRTAAGKLAGGVRADPGRFYRIGVLEMSPAASNAANFDLPIGLGHRPRDGSVVSFPALHE